MNITKCSRFSRAHSAIFLLLVILTSTGTHLIAFRGAFDFASDTSYYLDLVAYLTGAPTRDHAVPLRAGHPLFAAMVLAGSLITGDSLLAARLASLIPSILTAPLVCVLAWRLDRRLSVGVIAGVLAAFSNPLIQLSMSALADSLFLLLTAFFVLQVWRYSERPSLARAIATGVTVGLACATRPPGWLYPIVFFVPWFLARLAPPDGRVGVQCADRNTLSRSLQSTVCLLLFVLTFVSIGIFPGMWVRTLREDATRGRNYLTTAWIQPAVIAGISQEARTRLVYGLTPCCTRFQLEEEENLSWTVLLPKYAPLRVIGAIRNFYSLIAEDAVSYLLWPSGILVMPVVIGLISCWRNASTAQASLIVAFAFVQLVVIPVIHLEPRYLAPLLVLVYAWAATGMVEMMTATMNGNGAKERFVQFVGILLVLAFVLAGLYQIGRASRRGDPWVHYRAACTWLQASETDTAGRVMYRAHQLFAFLPRQSKALPVDSLDRIARYCLHSGVRHLIIGPVERNHNPHLNGLPPGVGERVEVGRFRFEILARFGEGAEMVQVVGFQSSHRGNNR